MFNENFVSMYSYFDRFLFNNNEGVGMIYEKQEFVLPLFYFLAWIKEPIERYQGLFNIQIFKYTGEWMGTRGKTCLGYDMLCLVILRGGNIR